MNNSFRANWKARVVLREVGTPRCGVRADSAARCPYP